MSLLNDALRKRKSEQSADGHCTRRTPRDASHLRHKRKGYQAAALGVAAVVAGAILAWSVWPPCDAISTVSSQYAPAERADLPPLEEELRTSPDTMLPLAGEAGKDPVDTVMATAVSSGATLAEAAEPSANAHPSPQAASERSSPQAASASAPAAGAIPLQRALAPTRTETVVSTPPQQKQKHRISFEGLYQKALSYHRQQRLEEAIGMYRDVLKIEPGHFDAGFNLSSIYLQTQAFDQAYAIAADLYLREPNDPKVMLNLAVAQIGCGRPRMAFELLDQAATRPQPPLFEIYFHKGVAHRHLDEAAQAIAWYRKAEAIKADEPHLLFNLAVALDLQGSYRQAVMYYQKFLQFPDRDASTRKKVAQRIRALRADLSAHPDEEEQAR
jgi:Flp pilus assembly protein TadD